MGQGILGRQILAFSTLTVRLGAPAAAQIFITKPCVSWAERSQIWTRSLESNPQHAPRLREDLWEEDFGHPPSHSASESYGPGK